MIRFTPNITPGVKIGQRTSNMNFVSKKKQAIFVTYVHLVVNFYTLKIHECRCFNFDLGDIETSWMLV